MLTPTSNRGAYKSVHYGRHQECVCPYQITFSQMDQITDYVNCLGNWDVMMGDINRDRRQ